MKAIQIPDLSRASLAPYLPIPYGSLKLVGMFVSIVLAVVINIAAYFWLPNQWFYTNLGILISGLFLVVGILIMKVCRDDVDEIEDTNWWTAYIDRNWTGYRLWIYKVDAEVRYRVLRAGVDPAELILEFPDQAKVMISIPLGGWLSVPTVRVRFYSLFAPVPIAIIGVERTSNPFTIRLVDRKFRDGWPVVIKDNYGNCLTVPVEFALDIVSDWTPRPFLGTLHYVDLMEVMHGLLEDHREAKGRSELNGARFLDARAVIEDAAQMILASTRFERSRDGKKIREFLELHLRMIDTGESEEEARANMTK